MVINKTTWFQLGHDTMIQWQIISLKDLNDTLLKIILYLLSNLIHPTLTLNMYFYIVVDY